MSNDAGATAGEDDGQGTETADAGTATDTATTTAEDWVADEWRALARELGVNPADVRKRLEHARTWEQRAKDNKAGADQAKTLQQQLDEMKSALADRDVRDTERAGRLAMTQLRSGLAEAGIKAEDVAELLDELDPVRLLKNGEPDDAAIAKRVAAFRRVAGRPTADPDQGRKGGDTPKSMGDVMREMARNR